MSRIILEIESLYKTYGEKENAAEALRGISFQVYQGEFLGIMGSSGSGKTTLLNCIASVLRPTRGRILLKGQDIGMYTDAQLAAYRGRQIGYLFQQFELLDNLTGGENILLPAQIHKMPAKESRKRMQKLAEYFEIEEVLEKFPNQMSGGQKQRVAALRALLLHPQIVLADEPTGALDSRSARSLMEQLSGVNREDEAAVLMVTHDAQAASFCSRILFIQDGKVFHELRKRVGEETNREFYERILSVMAQLGEEAIMFSELIRRNSKRNRQENTLYLLR